jgi:hypothetical protein
LVDSEAHSIIKQRWNQKEKARDKAMAELEIHVANLYLAKI